MVILNFIQCSPDRQTLEFLISSKQGFCDYYSSHFLQSLSKLRLRTINTNSGNYHIIVRINIPQELGYEVGLNCDQMEPPHEEQKSQQGVERNPNAYRSMRDYMHPPWVSTPSCIVPTTNAPHDRTYNPSWGNHPNFSWKLRPPQYAPPAHPQYPSTPQPSQPPQLTSSVEQAILSLRKLVGTFIEEQKAVNVQKNQRINTMESSLNKKLDGLQSDLDQKIDILHYFISWLTNQQHVHSEKENREKECLIDTTVEEHCKQHNEAISPLLTEEGNGKEVVEEPQKLILNPFPTKLNLSATAQASNSPLPATPSPEPVHILPTAAAHSIPETPTAKAISSALPVQNFRKLVAYVQTFATTSQTLAVSHIAWHN